MQWHAKATANQTLVGALPAARTRFHVVLAGIALGAVAACTEPPTQPSGLRPDGATFSLRPGESVAPLLDSATTPREAIIPDEYLVRLRDDVPNAPALIDALERTYQFQTRYRFTIVKGFWARIPAATLHRLRRVHEIAYLNYNTRAQLFEVQANPPNWGLDRIDQRALPLNQIYEYPNDAYQVRVYIVDSGMRTDHTEFGGRATFFWDVNSGGNGASCDPPGHGTRAASVAGGSTVGVAKRVTLLNVKVTFDCTTASSAGAITAAADQITLYGQAPAVVNASVGVPRDAILNEAVEGSIASGFTWVVAAGHSGSGEGTDACVLSPQSARGTITVTATTQADSRLTNSNYGPCVNMFAPGDAITTADPGASTGLRTGWGGSSAAAPHVAGIAAMYLAVAENPTPANVSNAMYRLATPNVVTNVGCVGASCTPNRLAYARLLADVRASGPTELPACDGGDYYGSWRDGVGPLQVRWYRAYYRYDGTWIDDHLVGTGPVVTILTPCDADNSSGMYVTLEVRDDIGVLLRNSIWTALY